MTQNILILEVAPLKYAVSSFRGRTSELISYWRFLGVEQASLGKKYVDVIKTIEAG